MGLGIRNLRRNFSASSLLVCLISLCALFAASAPAQAAAGINQEMNFQGRLLNNQGAIVPDGYYNIEFKIYQDGDGLSTGDSTGSPAGTLLWTEDYVDNNANAGVQVVNGYMSVQLGSICAFGGGSCQGHTNAGVNWNSDTLWLSMNIAGSNNACTSFNGASCTADGEMTPMKRLSANAYAMNALSSINSQELGGVSSGNFVQFATNTLQTNSTTNNSIYINNTSTGNLVDFQTAGVNSFMINNNGNVVFGANATHTISVATAAASTAGQALTLSAGAAGTGSGALAGGTLTLDGGAGGGTNGNGGNLALDAGAANGTGTAGTVTIGGNYASTITLGNATNTTQAQTNAGGASTTLTSNGQKVQGSGSSSATNAFQVVNGNGTSLFQLVDDSTVNLGVNPSNAYSFGYNSIGSNGQDSGYNAIITGQKFTASSTTTLHSISVYVGPTVEATKNSYQVALYSDSSGSPSSQIASSAVGTLTANSWNTMAITASVTSGTTYWLVYDTNVDAGQGTANGMDYTSSSSGNTHFYAGWTFGTTGAGTTNGLPSTISSSTIVNSLAESIYASASAGPAITINNSGTITTQTTFQNTTNTTTALVVQNSTGNQVLDVDTSNNQVVLGKAGTLNGQELLQSSGGSNYVGIAAPTTNPNSSYVLSLPSTAPSANNQCLQTSSTFTQLTFGACGITGSFVNNAYGTTQTANFNIKGASATTTTAVIASDGADILDLLNSSAGTVATFDQNGNFVDSATGSSSFAGTLTVATKVVTPTLDTASSVPLNIGATSSQINLNQNVYIANGASSITEATPASGNGTNFSLNGSTGASGNNNGGNVSIDAGAKTGTGTDGTINIGTNHASAINIGKSGVTTTNNGNEVINGTLSTGKSGTSNGSLAFNNSSSNAITLSTLSSASTYNLILPTSVAAGLCLETAPGVSGTTQQLVFASCTNNNSSIQEVQEHDTNNSNTLSSFTPTTIGDEIVVTTQIPTVGVSVCSITDSDVTSWSKVGAINGDSGNNVHRIEMWVGTVTSVATQNVAVSYTNGGSCGSASPGSNEITATEFTAAGVNASTSWGIESASTQLNSVASSTVTYPSATSVDGSELYIGYAQIQNPPPPNPPGTTTNFSYISTSIQHNVITYDTDLSANTTYQPTASQNSSGESNTIDTVLTAFVTSTSINNTTSLQKANFYVQAASSGTVAGILQAASSGNADIFDIKNGAGNANYLQVGSTGELTLNPATTSGVPVAMQVLNNTSNNSVFSVDSYNNQTILGSSNHIAGTLTFDDPSDSNSISLVAPTSIATSYSLYLPNNTPTAGLCLGTDPSNANQLIYASCATQVSAAGITYVNKWTATASGNTTVSDSPATKGDLLVLFSHTTGNVNISSFSGTGLGGVSSWTKITAYSSAGGTQGNVEMWRGVVNTTGSGSVTVNYSTGTVGTTDVSIEEFTMGSAQGTWAIDTSGTGNSTSAATINYPTLTAQNSSELYTGYAWGANAMTPVTYTGFTYAATASSKYLAYDTSVTGGVAYTPSATQTAGAYASIGAMIEAYSGTSVIVSSTATQEANFNVQAATANTVAGVLQAASGSSTSDIFDARDASGNNIVAVNASSGLTLGTSNTVGGQLNFNASGNGNIITIAAPSAPGANYTLTLPTTTPAPGQCLASSPSNANQLVFSSCANQVTSVAITYVNNWTDAFTGNTLSCPGGWTVSPTNLGDIMVAFIAPQKSNTVNSLTGGGVSAWSQVTSTINGTGMAMWRGQVTTTGSQCVALSLSGASGNNDIAIFEYTTGSTTGSWVVDSSNSQYNSTSSTTVAYPNLTPQSTKDLYIGYARGTSTMSAGSTTGFTYTTSTTTTDMGAYNTAISTTVQPNALQSISGTSTTAGALIAAYSSSSVIANSTNSQQANFNVQAATSGSVAGVLQAYYTGSADILDIYDGGSHLTDSFGYTGNLLIQPYTASASALQVQTPGPSGVNVFSVDTNAKLVNIGKGAAGSEPSPSLLVLDNETGTSADPTLTTANGTGAMYYNATTNAFRCSIDGAWENCNSLLYANTSASSVNNNCSNNCVAFSNSASIPANYCQAGRVITLNANGYFSSQATATTLQFGIYYGTDASIASNDTLIGTLTPSTSVTSASSNYFQLNDTITCFSTTSVQSGGLFNLQTGSSGSGMLALPLGASTTTTVVTSGSPGTYKNLYIFPVWGTASTSNTATLSQLTVNNY
jgi:hypothetical protein